MKTSLLVLASLLMISSPGWAGGISSVGPQGPDADAQDAFEKSPQIEALIQEVKAAGYLPSAPELNANQLIGLINCKKPFEGATFTTCDRVNLFTRIFKSPAGIKIVGAKVTNSDQGFEIESFQK